MAKIETVTQSVVTGVKLELTKDEADAVFALLGMCAARGPTSRIWQAFQEAGFREQVYDVKSAYNGVLFLNKVY